MPEAGLAGTAPALLPDDLALGVVAVRSRDPARLVPFYEEAVGLSLLASGADGAVLGAGGRPLVEILRAPDAVAPPRRVPGLFHMAIRVPDRAALAARLLAIHRLDARMGASDHLVSEALYVDDPDGNGIEIYRDRARPEWPRMPNGEIAMETLPLDLSALLAAAPAAPTGAPEGTDLGHMHLKVSDLDAARRFWVDVVGFEIMARYPGALFVSAGGYHHHLGLNVWQSAGAPPAPASARGLDHFTFAAGRAGLDALAGRLADAGVAVTGGADELRFSDPSGNRVRARVRL